MSVSRLASLAALAFSAATLGACTYVERERPPQQATVLVPQQAPATVVTPAPAPPTVTVRPSY
ncbi:hypothetical protein [Falsiroseomonas oryzae]|uniref:hypothetical protein n=1 Tax=Falsiroseomonas oryzae TaxID=2766473 RepID=UPI0022EAF268|nr:hypothetical protein [Roseomonas sp. MO-31]